MHLYSVIIIMHKKKIFNFLCRNTKHSAETNTIPACSHFVVISACA